MHCSASDSTMLEFVRYTNFVIIIIIIIIEVGLEPTFTDHFSSTGR